MIECYSYKREISESDLIHYYKERLLTDLRYSQEIIDSHISIDSSFIVYPSLDGMVKNLKYLIVKKDSSKNGVLDVSASIISKDFILNELSTLSFIKDESSLDDFSIYNKEDVEKYERSFINSILDKAIFSICKRHNLIYTIKENHIDVAPIENFYELNKKYYLEQIYIISYFIGKKRYKSIYSTIKNDFYSFEFVESNSFKLFLKKYKKPIIYIPKNYLKQYYDIAFRVYLRVEEELKYIDYSSLYNKLRKNIRYRSYTCYEDYLKQLIFYFKRKQYLKELLNPYSSLKDSIFYYYLTLRYNLDSGYKLAELMLNNVIEDNHIYYLKISANLGNAQAKKKLYEYYSSPKYFNEGYLRRYS